MQRTNTNAAAATKVFSILKGPIDPLDTYFSEKDTSDRT